MRRDSPLCTGLFLFLAMLVSSPVLAQEASKAPSHPVIWVDRGNISDLDLLAGYSETRQEPGTNFTFIKESLNGTAPKFDVEDENGHKWKVKLGEEGKPETAATRLVWAMGYFVDEDYYRDEIHVAGMKHLSRGQQFVHHGNTVVGARLERHHSGPDPMIWSWYNNPFSGTREFNGLRVVMALINNWDLKNLNNAVYVDPDGEKYAIADLGATFGRTGDQFMRSKGNAKEYAASPFVQKVTEEYVDFTLRSQPFFLSLITNFRNFMLRSKIERIAHRIPIEDVRWIGGQLDRLSREQVRDCFRAGGFSTTDVDTFTQVVMQRIAALKKI